MTNFVRRSSLCVPASNHRMVEKALKSPADEVVVDLEDAVAVSAKETARDVIAALGRRACGTIAVRVNGAGTPWHVEDLLACGRNPAVDSIVIPKAERPEDLQAAGSTIAAARAPHDGQWEIQALIESARGLLAAPEIAAATPSLGSLILGYADLAASLGRRAEASFGYAQDVVLVAARAHGLQAIDGPQLTVTDDEQLADSVMHAAELGFDGKWVIHPCQIGTVQAGFTPSTAEVEEARAVVSMMDEAAASGTGAVAWNDRMLDEALVAAARRVLSRRTI